MSGEASLAGSKIRQTAETSGMVGRDSDLSAACVRLWRAVQKEKPLVQCITNWVSMDFMANTLNAIGASPAMVRHCKDFSLWKLLGFCLDCRLHHLAGSRRRRGRGICSPSVCPRGERWHTLTGLDRVHATSCQGGQHCRQALGLGPCWSRRYEIQDAGSVHSEKYLEGQ